MSTFIAITIITQIGQEQPPIFRKVDIINVVQVDITLSTVWKIDRLLWSAISTLLPTKFPRKYSVRTGLIRNTILINGNYLELVPYQEKLFICRGFHISDIHQLSVSSKNRQIRAININN